MIKKNKKLVILVVILGCLSACANNQKNSNEDKKNQESSVKSEVTIPTVMHPMQGEDKIMYDYELYDVAITALHNKQTGAAYNFLATQAGQNNSMVEKVRVGLLRVLGKNGSWGEFMQQYPLLPKDVNELEVNCYAATAGHSSGDISLSKLSQKLVKSNEKLPESCNRMIQTAATKGILSQQDIWRRVRILLSHNYISLAKSLASAIGQPLTNSYDGSKGSKVMKLMRGITPKDRNRADIDSFLYGLYGKVDQDDIAFAEGIVGLSKARDLNMSSALQHFNKADKAQLSKEQWEWYARAALRLQQWVQLNQIIQAMPHELKESPAWLYWQGRARVATGDAASARILYEKATTSGRNFYAILAHEELGKPLNVSSNANKGNHAAVMSLAKDGQIHRALVLFKNAVARGDRKMREAAQNQWKYATKNFNDSQKILASQLASQNQFYEMSIYSANMSDGLLSYEFRFPAPHKSIVDKYTNMYGIESAWVYGLIRQESRFMTVAKSVVGASGLMQIMPSTAQMISRKLGLDGYSLNNLDTNVNMGVWYLADLYSEFRSEPLATSAYNAGPGRARKWRQSGLEGAIYAETIPFNETRDYVKKVMSNTTYYAHLFGNTKRTLKFRLGRM